MNIYICIYIFKGLYTNVFANVGMSTDLYIYIYIHVYAYKYIYLYLYIYMYIYTIQTSSRNLTVRIQVCCSVLQCVAVCI